MNRSLKLSVLVALALGSTPALALTLGQIQVKSALDRPLLAVIPLHPDHPGEADHVKVTLASADAFTRAGISRADLKVPLTFKVLTNAQGQKVIRVTSAKPIRRTYLDFLIRVSWPKGKLLREYTVLLDPLSMMPSAPAAAAAPAAAKVPPAQTLASQPSTTKTQAESAQTSTRPATAPATPSHGHVYGPVPYGDTLSQIALDHAASGVSYQQMLIALKSANPNAFYRNNVNALKAGAILRIPTRAQALTVTRKAAIAAVRQQNQTWQSHHAVAPTLVASAGGSSAPIVAAGQAASSGDRLHLVPPKASSDDPVGGGGGGGGGGGQAKAAELRQDLARNKEALSSQKQAAADLQSRVTALQQIADKNKRLLGLKNAEIAELQQKLAAARKTAGLPALAASAPAPAQAGVAAATAAGSEASLAAASTAAGTSAAAVVAHPGNAATKPESAKAAKPKPVSAAATHHAATGSTPWYAQLWARIVLIIIILLLIAWMVMRRRKPSGKAPRKSLADDFGDSPLGPDADAAAAAEADDDASPLEPFVDSDGEGELLAHLGEHPDDVGLHLELASLYFARRDASQFEGAAEAMHAYVEDEAQPEWQDVVSMGHELAPDHPLFAQAGRTAFADDEAASMSPEEAMFEAEDRDDGDEARTAASTEGALEAHSVGYSLDFDLDPEPSRPHEPDQYEAPATQLPDESEFDALPPLPVEADDMDEPEDAMDLAVGRSEPTRPKPAPDLAATFGMDDPVDGFSDDPVDTKLDLARAYMDMGDHDGARAMLAEALNEGSQMQKDTAQKLIDELA